MWLCIIIQNSAIIIEMLESSEKRRRGHRDFLLLECLLSILLDSSFSASQWPWRAGVVFKIWDMKPRQSERKSSWWESWLVINTGFLKNHSVISEYLLRGQSNVTHKLPTMHIWKMLMVFIPDKSWLDLQARWPKKRRNWFKMSGPTPLLGNISYWNVINT